MTEPALPLVSPFGSQDYELLCEHLVLLREATIRSRHARPMRVGDLCTLSQDGQVYELVVTDFSNLGEEGWSVRCQIVETHGK